MTKHLKLSLWVLAALAANTLVVYASPQGSKTLKIISYNLFEGMRMDTTAGKQVFVRWVLDKDPDVMALQEVNKFTQKSLEEMARQYKHPYAVLLKEPGFPVALTSKYPIVNVKKAIDNLHHGFIQAEIEGYQIIVLHLSPHKYWKRREEIDLINSTIAAHTKQKKWVIMGDFNSLSALDSLAYQDGRILEKTKAAMKKYSHHDNLVEGKLDFEVQDRLLKTGLVDALKQTHREFISSRPTQATSKNGENPPSRIDYIYISRDLKTKIVKADILKDDFTNWYSDHYPVYLEIKK